MIASGNKNDMTLVLLLLAVLLLCIFAAAALLWICTNIVKLQSERNYMLYGSTMSARTPDFFSHAGAAPSTPDYYRTDKNTGNIRRDVFQQKG